jgi:hypothetical protein
VYVVRNTRSAEVEFMGVPPEKKREKEIPSNPTGNGRRETVGLDRVGFISVVYNNSVSWQRRKDVVHK